MVTYQVSAYIVDESEDFKLDAGPENPLEVEVDLQPSLIITNVGRIIDDAIRTKYERFGYSYKSQMLSIDDVLVDAQEDIHQLDYYIFGSEPSKVTIEAFVVDNSATRGLGGPPVFFQDLSNQENLQFFNVEDAENLPMQQGLAIKVRCQNKSCQSNLPHLHPIKFTRTGTASYDVIKNSLNCDQCKQAYDLVGVYFTQCEYKFKGEKQATRECVNFDWSTVPKGRVCKLEDDERHPEISNRIYWNRLLIHVKKLTTGQCRACKQRIGDDDITADTKCGHTYHTECCSKLRRRICSVPGCVQTL